MEDKINLNYVLDSQGARLERTNKRLFILSVILIIALLASNGFWIAYESQFMDESQIEQEADGNSNNYIVGGNYGSQTEDN